MDIITFIHEYPLYSIISKDSYLRDLPFLILGMISFPHLKMPSLGMVCDNMTLVLSHRSGSGGHRCSQFITLYIHLDTHMYIYICMYFYNFLYACTARSREGIGM